MHSFSKFFFRGLGDSNGECFANMLTGPYEFYPTDYFSIEMFYIKYIYTIFTGNLEEQ